MTDDIIGIDLGTTNSEVAVCVDGRIELVEEDGSPIMPSYVGLAPAGELIVGAAARNQYILHPDRTVRSVKRRMGSDEKISMGNREYLPQELSAMILRALKDRAQRRLGRPVEKAVITVPAQFSDAQRQATRDAGEIAGLEVVRIVNEPTAACLAYEKEDAEPGGHHVLAFDLGGGTFDVSVVRVEGDIVEVISSHGDNQLGGDDMDASIVEWIEAQLEADGKRPHDLATSARYRLTRSAETAKLHLSDHPHANIIETNLETTRRGDASINSEFSRLEFEDRIRPLVNRTLVAAHEALTDAGLKPDQIDDIILVGGATRIPCIQQRIEEEMGRRPRRDVHPDLAVAYGAGVMAARLMGSDDHRILVDITPYTFGTSALGILDGVTSPHRFVPVIKSGAPLPVSRTEGFGTVVDEQESIDVAVFQGESQDARQNTLIGRFNVTGLSPVPAGNEIDLTMGLDLDGILRVTAIEKDTGLSKDITIENAMAKLSEEAIARSRAEIRELFGDIEDTATEDKAATDSADRHLDEAPHRSKAQATAAQAAAAMDRMEAMDREDATAILDKLHAAIERDDRAAIEDAATELDDLLFYVETD